MLVDLDSIEWTFSYSKVSHSWKIYAWRMEDLYKYYLGEERPSFLLRHKRHAIGLSWFQNVKGNKFSQLYVTSIWLSLASFQTVFEYIIMIQALRETFAVGEGGLNEIKSKRNSPPPVLLFQCVLLSTLLLKGGGDLPEENFSWDASCFLFWMAFCCCNKDKLDHLLWRKNVLVFPNILF